MVSVTVQETPNPDARRFLVDQPVQERQRGTSYTAGDGSEDPLADRLLGLFGVEAVMLLPGSVTVTKIDSSSWEELEPTVREAIEAHFSS